MTEKAANWVGVKAAIEDGLMAVIADGESFVIAASCAAAEEKDTCVDGAAALITDTTVVVFDSRLPNEMDDEVFMVTILKSLRTIRLCTMLSRRQNRAVLIHCGAGVYCRGASLVVLKTSTRPIIDLLDLLASFMPISRYENLYVRVWFWFPDDEKSYFLGKTKWGHHLAVRLHIIIRQAKI